MRCSTSSTGTISAAANATPKLWNVAADLMINRVLEENDYLLPAEGLFDRERRFAGLPTETIYARLLEERQAQEQPQQQEEVSDSSGSGGVDPGPGGKGNNPSVDAAGQDGADDTGGNHAGGPLLARRWGEVRDLTTETGKTPQRRRAAAGRTRSRCPDPPGRGGCEARRQIQHHADRDGRDRRRSR